MSSTEKTERVAVAGPLSGRTRARQVGDLVGSILEEVVARRSGMNLDLIAAWEDIAGPEFAGHTRPEKIQWPRQATDPDALAPGTLVVACDGARAVFLQHQAGEIVSRLNMFFGFEAIERIRIVQKPVVRPAQRSRRKPELTPEERRRLDGMLHKVADPELRKRLDALGTGVLAQGRKGP